MEEAKTRWRWVLAALAAGAVAAALAPRPWGEVDRVEVTGPGRVVSSSLENPVTVTLEGAGAETGVHVILADGRRERAPIVSSADGAAVALRRRPVHTRLALALLAVVVVLWISEAIPLFATSLLVPIALVAAGAQNAKIALAPFFHPLIALFLGGFLMAEAMKKAELDKLVAHWVVTRAGKTPARLFGAMLGVSAFLSMWMSNTAAAAVLVPIALAVTEPLHHLGYRKALVLGIAYAATIGGCGSLIGTPANPIAAEFLGAFAGREITFTSWFAIGLPMVAVFLPVMGIYLWRYANAEVPEGAFQAMRAAARAHAPTVRREQLVVGLTFCGVMTLWLTQQWHHLDNGIIALMGAAALALLGKIDTQDLGRISWSALLTFGGGLALGGFLMQSGTSDWMATRLEVLASLPGWLGVTIVAALALAMTAVASNTATAAMLVPLAIPLAGIIGADPVLLVATVAVATSVDFALVVGTPPTMIAYATNLYTTREIFRAGIVLDLIGIALLVTAVASIWRLVGIV